MNALKSNEWSSSSSWDKGIYYQGDSGFVTPTFYSNCPDQLQIISVDIEFDWSTTSITETVNSPNLATGNQYTCDSIYFNIPSGASVGSHSYTITYNGQQKGLLGWYDYSVSATGSVNIHDAYEKIYNQDINSVQTSLTHAQNSYYQSPEAQSLVQQAANIFNQATSLANQGQWQAAVNDLNSASNYLSQASAKEAMYPPATATPYPTVATPEFPAMAIVGIFLTLSLVTVMLVTMIKRKNHSWGNQK